MAGTMPCRVSDSGPVPKSRTLGAGPLIAPAHPGSGRRLRQNESAVCQECCARHS